MKIRIVLKYALRKVFLLSALLFFTLHGCKEDGALVPQFNSASLDLYDTVITLTTTTVVGDSLRTDGISRSLLGQLNDDVFGLSVADFYTQFYMEKSNLELDPDFIAFDSVVLELGYDEFYGYDYEQEVQVYEVIEDLDDDSYYSNHSSETSDLLIGSGKLKVGALDSLDGDSTHVIKIRLDDEIGQRVVQQRVFPEQQTFLDLINGFKITIDKSDVPSEAGEGAIVYFNLTSSKTVLKMYYHDEFGPTESINFVVSGSSTWYSAFSNTYSSFMNNVLDGTTQTTTNYLSAMSGLRTKISFNNMVDWASELPISVNKAELIIRFDDPAIPVYEEPERLTMIEKNDEGNWVLPIDYTKQGSDFFGGNLEIDEYRFNIPSTLHEVLNKGEVDKELFLTISGGAVTAERMEINGGAHPDRSSYLVLTYTKSR